MARAEGDVGSSESDTKTDSAADASIIVKAKKVLQDISTGAKACGHLVKELNKKSQAADVTGALGLDFLEMKNHLLLDYLIGLSGVCLTKSAGKSIVGSPFVDQLVETRTILEKIRPIDQKLKYQVDKLVKTAVEGKAESDPLSFKANPDNLEGRGEDSDEDSDDDEDVGKKDSASKSGVYRPPKVAPQHFDDEDNDPAKSAEKVKRKSINRALIRELQEEYLETPVEIHNMGDGYDKQLSRETRDKQRFEETYMTRLPMTKKDKHKEGMMSTLGVLGDELTDFSRKRGSASDSKSKKRKSGGKAKGGKKRFRK